MRALLIAISVVACSGGAGSTSRSGSASTGCVGCDLDVDEQAEPMAARQVESSSAEPRARQGPGDVVVVGRRSRTELIDVDFKNVDIHNAVRLLAEVGKISVVISDEVRGSVTLRLRRVSWRQALDAVVAVEQLRLVRRHGIYRVEPR